MRCARITCLSQKVPRQFPVLDFLLPSSSIAFPNFYHNTKNRSRLITQSRRYATAPDKRNHPVDIKKSHEESKINGPLSTLPAFVETPSQKPGQNKFMYLISIGKTYIGFYKTGLVNVKNNFYAARPIHKIVSASHKGSALAAAAAGDITRSEYQLLLRNQHDLKRVPMFALVVLICGEFTPLVVIALSNVVPWTCRIPKQIQMDRKKLEERRSISFRNLTLPPVEEAGVEQLHRMQALHINWSLGLSSRLWDWLGGQLPGLPTSLLKRKVKRRIEYLKVDDALIAKYGGVRELSLEEVKLACVERGLDVLDRGEREIRGDLEAWIKSSKQVPYERLMLLRLVLTVSSSTIANCSRPPQWPTKGAARPPKQES